MNGKLIAFIFLWDSFFHSGRLTLSLQVKFGELWRLKTNSRIIAPEPARRNPALSSRMLHEAKCDSHGATFRWIFISRPEERKSSCQTHLLAIAGVYKERCFDLRWSDTDIENVLLLRLHVSTNIRFEFHIQSHLSCYRCEESISFRTFLVAWRLSHFNLVSRLACACSQSLCCLGFRKFRQSPVEALSCERCASPKLCRSKKRLTEPWTHRPRSPQQIKGQVYLRCSWLGDSYVCFSAKTLGPAKSATRVNSIALFLKRQKLLSWPKVSSFVGPTSVGIAWTLTFAGLLCILPEVEPVCVWGKTAKMKGKLRGFSGLACLQSQSLHFIPVRFRLNPQEVCPRATFAHMSVTWISIFFWSPNLLLSRHLFGYPHDFVNFEPTVSVGRSMFMDITVTDLNSPA